MKYVPPPLDLRVWLLSALMDPEACKWLSEEEWAWLEGELREVVAQLLGWGSPDFLGSPGCTPPCPNL